ncbi:MAG TPA: hypothetical protein VLL54_21035 [Pyrinomonadaceae bacterium]|nr:hypothetical protein [Pyrinomonadaceae bacterium]
MRATVLVLTLAATLGLLVFHRQGVQTKTYATTSSPFTRDTSSTIATETKPTAKVDFSTQIKPVLQAKCQPCHFSGGKMYDKMPFDRGETIKTLGTKLFTRIKDENERRIIREFLAQP